VEKLFGFLQRFFGRDFFGTITLRFESGKVTHVDVETKRSYRFRDIPREENDP